MKYIWYIFINLVTKDQTNEHQLKVIISEDDFFAKFNNKNEEKLNESADVSSLACSKIDESVIEGYEEGYNIKYKSDNESIGKIDIKENLKSSILARKSFKLRPEFDTSIRDPFLVQEMNYKTDPEYETANNKMARSYILDEWKNKNGTESSKMSVFNNVGIILSGGIFFNFIFYLNKIKNS